MLIAGYSAAAIALCWFVLPYLLRKVQVARLRQYCRQTRSIALTYDDGPGGRVTSRLHELLDSFDAVATFFPLGCKLDDPASAIGTHEIGSHSYSHLHAWTKSPISVYRDIDRGLQSISRLSSSRLFRPPHGKTTLATLAQLWAHRCVIAWWTIDSSDTWQKALPISAVIERIKLDGGGVVLMHDHDRSIDHEREDYVVDLTRAILGLARDEGFKICRMSELV